MEKYFNKTLAEYISEKEQEEKLKKFLYKIKEHTNDKLYESLWKYLIEKDWRVYEVEFIWNIEHETIKADIKKIFNNLK